SIGGIHLVKYSLVSLPHSNEHRYPAVGAPCQNLSQRSGRYRDPGCRWVGRELALCLVWMLFGDNLPGDSEAELKLRTAGTSKQLHEFSREQLPALALVPIVTASITMAGGGRRSAVPSFKATAPA